MKGAGPGFCKIKQHPSLFCSLEFPWDPLVSDTERRDRIEFCRAGDD